jgi:hypothetical protein
MYLLKMIWKKARDVLNEVLAKKNEIGKGDYILLDGNKNKENPPLISSMVQNKAARYRTKF